MDDLKQFQGMLKQSELRYKRCLKRFGFSSSITQRAAQQLVILIRIEHDYFNS
jgi:hypothetical protein